MHCIFPSSLSRSCTHSPGSENTIQTNGLSFLHKTKMRPFSSFASKLSDVIQRRGPWSVDKPSVCF